MSDPLEISQAELEALERAPVKPPKKKARKRKAIDTTPRDERGRFTKIKARKKP